MIYDILRWIGIITGYPVQYAYFKTKTFYEDKSVQSKKIKGGALVISNHFSVIDYGVNMFTLLPRLLHVVTSEIAYRYKFTSWGVKCFGGIKADRINRSMQFIDDAVKRIKIGKLVQIFPEAKNTDDGTIKPFKTSYILIALRSERPIIPIILDGNYGWFKRTHLIIGKPIDLSKYCTSKNPSREEIVQLNEMVYSKVLELRERLEELKKSSSRKGK